MKNTKHAAGLFTTAVLAGILVLGAVSVGFSKPVVTDAVSAGYLASRYVPQTSDLQGVTDAGDHYNVAYAWTADGMNVSYDIAVSKAEQRVTSSTTRYNNNRAGSTVSLSESQVREQLAKRVPSATIDTIELNAGAAGSYYTVNYHSGATTGTIELDAATGNTIEKTVNYATLNR